MKIKTYTDSLSSTDIAVLNKIFNFLRGISIPVDTVEINKEMFLPGLRIEKGVLQVDFTKLLFLGDILHEAGHIAITPIESRNSLSGSLEGEEFAAANEMAVLAWTYAACLEIGISPAIVFHPDGYKGDADNLLSNFEQGRYLGVPILQWYGMTKEKESEGNSVTFPKMIRWTRD